MAEACGGSCLPLEATVHDSLPRQDLDRHVALEALIPRHPHGPETSGPQGPVQAVAAEDEQPIRLLPWCPGRGDRGRFPEGGRGLLESSSGRTRKRGHLGAFPRCKRLPLFAFCCSLWSYCSLQISARSELLVVL